jgi:hypothetical protein
VDVFKEVGYTLGSAIPTYAQLLNPHKHKQHTPFSSGSHVPSADRPDLPCVGCSSVPLLLAIKGLYEASPARHTASLATLWL